MGGATANVGVPKKQLIKLKVGQTRWDKKGKVPIGKGLSTISIGQFRYLLVGTYMVGYDSLHQELIENQ